MPTPTAALALVFGARFGVQQWPYTADATGALAAAEIAMGTPLLAATLPVVAWAYRRTTTRLTRSSS